MSLRNLKSIFEDELKARTEDYISNSVTNVANTKLNYNNNNLIAQTYGFDVSMETRGGRNNPILDSLLRGREYKKIRFSQDFENNNLFVKPETGEITDQLFKDQTFDPRAPFAKEGTLYFNTNKSFNPATNPTDFSTAVGNNDLPFTPITSLGGQFKENLSWENLYNSNHSPKDNPTYKEKPVISYGPNVSRDNLNIRGSSNFRTSLISGVGTLVNNLNVFDIGLINNLGNFLQDTGKEPYIVSTIPETQSDLFSGRTVNSNFLGRGLPIERGITDTVRIAKFLTSPAGLLFIGKQEILLRQNQKYKVGYKPLSTLISTLGRAGGGPVGLFDRTQPSFSGLIDFVTGGAVDLDTYPNFIQTAEPTVIIPAAGAVSSVNGTGSPLARIILANEPFGGLESLQSSLSTQYFENFIKPKFGPFRQTVNVSPSGGVTTPTDSKETSDEGLIKLSDTFTGFGDPTTQPVGNTYPQDAGDIHTLIEFGMKDEELSEKLGRTQYKENIEDAHPNDSTNGMIEGSENGMPFYFKDMRDGAFVFFRAYIEGLTENISPSYASHNYIGRSEPVYTYERAEREISFTLKLIAQTSNELKMIYKKMNRLTSMCYPEYVDEGETGYGNRMKPPLAKLRMGELFGKSNKELMGYIKSVSYAVDNSATYETNPETGRVPTQVITTIGYQVIHDKVPSLDTKFYGINQ